VPYGITQCYLPPGRGDIPAFTPAMQLRLVLEQTRRPSQPVINVVDFVDFNLKTYENAEKAERNVRMHVIQPAQARQSQRDRATPRLSE